MPRVVPYSECLETMHSLKLRSLYYNSGAFGFEKDAPTQSVGWICEEDPSLRPEARSLARMVRKPAPKELADRLARAAGELLPSPTWMMPKSHWAFELDFGSKSWMPHALADIGIDSRILAERTTGDPIEFGADEIPMVENFAFALLSNLQQSDFAIAFPKVPLVCTLHHHKQIWWTTTERALLDALAQLAG